MIAAASIFTASTVIALGGLTATALVGVGVAALNSRAESHRLREQFAFQRWETDRQELRAMIDSLAADLAALPDALTGLWRMIELEQSLSLTPGSDNAQALTSRVAKDLISLADAQDAASRSLERVRLRLDNDVTHCLAIAEAMIDRSREPVRPWTDSSHADLLPAGQETAEQYRVFVAEARKITASATPYDRS